MSAAIYVHVPFCRRKCLYCDFASQPYRCGDEKTYLDAVLTEISLRAGEATGPAKTVYVGGGTPSVVDPNVLARILDAIRDVFGLAPGAEITAEANPESARPEVLSAWREAGVNRLSLGVQAWQERLLRALGRVHDRDAVLRAYEAARAAGFDNVSVDLMFGLPGQAMADWAETLAAVVDLAPEHISAYALQVEEGTPLERLVASGRVMVPDEDTQASMYDYLRGVLAAAGYEHYEISNFARPGYRCRHNLVYWRNGDYVGLGPAAWSHRGRRRWGNTPDLATYAARLRAGVLPVAEEETVDDREAMGETMMLGLRLVEGVDEQDFYIRFGVSARDVFGHQVAELVDRGLLEEADGRLRLTGRGLLLGNVVFGAFV